MKKVAGKPIIFARVGGLSPVVQKGYKEHRAGKAGEHAPPAPKGIYAFVYPYIETFILFGYGLDKWRPGKRPNHKDDWMGPDVPREPTKKIAGLRKFKYEGPIWHHLQEHTDPRLVLAEKGSWVKTEYDVYVEALRKELHRMRREDRRYQALCPTGDRLPRSNNPTFAHCKDHLEVFIEDIH
jgi:hypothetical protein